MTSVKSVPSYAVEYTAAASQNNFRYDRKATQDEISDVFYRAAELSYYHGLPLSKCKEIVIQEYAERGIEVVLDLFRNTTKAEGS